MPLNSQSEHRRSSYWLTATFCGALNLLIYPFMGLADPMPGGKPMTHDELGAMRARHANAVPGFTQSSKPPANFPLPVYSYNATMANFCSSTSGANQAMQGTVMTKDAPSMAFNWYKNTLKTQGWTLNDKPVERPGQSYQMSASKGNMTVSIVCAAQANGGAVVNVSCIPAPGAKK